MHFSTFVTVAITGIAQLAVCQSTIDPSTITDATKGETLSPRVGLNHDLIVYRPMVHGPKECLPTHLLAASRNIEPTKGKYLRSGELSSCCHRPEPVLINDTDILGLLLRLQQRPTTKLESILPDHPLLRMYPSSHQLCQQM